MEIPYSFPGIPIPRYIRQEMKPKAFGAAMQNKKNFNEDYIDRYVSNLFTAAQQEDTIKLLRTAPKNEFSRTQEAAIVEFQSPKLPHQTFAVVVDPGISIDKDTYYFLALHPDGEVDTSIEVYTGSGLIDFVEFNDDPESSDDLNKGKITSFKITQKFSDIVELLRAKKIIK